MTHRKITRRAWVAAAIAAVVLVASGGAASAGESGDRHRDRDRDVTVVTYNVDFGADLAPLFTLPAEQLVGGAAKAYATMLASDYPGRADALARVLAHEAPDVIGLQEVALWQTMDLTDPKPAWVTTNDYEALLLKALARRGVPYRVVASNATFQAQLPIAATAAGPTKLVSFTDQNLVLVRRDSAVSATNAQQARYTASIPLPAPLSLKITRGWASADVTVHGLAFRFVTTHLEAYSLPSPPLPQPDPEKEYFRNLQAAQLMATLAASPLPVVLTGDMNSRPTCTGRNTAAYGLIVGAGYTEVWPATHHEDPCGGFTSGNRDTATATGVADHRIDDVFFRASALRAVDADVIGLTETTRHGMWISDHAGTVATLTRAGHGHDGHDGHDQDD